MDIPPQTLGNWLEGHWVSVILVPVVVYALQLARRLEKALDKHEQTLFGATGVNGLVNDMKMVRKTRHDDANLLTAFELRISLLEKEKPKT